MDDNKNDILQERQPKRLETFKSYKPLAGEDLTFDDFSNNLQDPDYAKKVYGELSESQGLGIAEDDFYKHLDGEGWALNSFAKNNKFATKETVEEVEGLKALAEEKYPIEKLDEDQSWWERWANSDPRQQASKSMAGGKAIMDRADFVSKGTGKIWQREMQKASDAAALEVGAMITPETTTDDLVQMMQETTGFNSEYDDRASKYEDGVFRTIDEAGYVANGLVRTYTGAANNMDMITEKLGDETIESWKSTVRTLNKFESALEEARKDEDEAAYNEIMSSDELKQAHEAYQVFQNNDDIKDYQQQQALYFKSSGSMEDVDKIDPAYRQGIKDRADRAKEVDENHREMYGITKVADVTWKNVALGLAEIPKDAAALFELGEALSTDGRGWAFELSRFTQETIENAEALTLPSNATRGVYEDVVNIGEYEAVVDDGKVSAVYGPDGYVVSEDKFAEISSQYNPETDESTMQLNGMSMWGNSVKMGTDLAVLMAGTKGMDKVLKVGKLGKLGSGYVDVVAPRLAMFGTMTAQIQGDYYNEAIKAGFSPRDAGYFALASSGIVSAVNQFNPQFYLMGKASNAVGVGVREAYRRKVAGVSTEKAMAIAFGKLFRESAKEGMEEVAEIPAENFVRGAFNGIDYRTQLEIQNDRKDYAESYTLGAALGFVSGGGSLKSRGRIQKEALWSLYQDEAATKKIIIEKYGEESQELKNIENVFQGMKLLSDTQNFTAEEKIQVINKLDQMYKSEELYNRAAQSGDKISEDIYKKEKDQFYSEIEAISNGDKESLTRDSKRDFSKEPTKTEADIEGTPDLKDTIEKTLKKKTLTIGNDVYEIISEDAEIDGTYTLSNDKGKTKFKVQKTDKDNGEVLTPDQPLKSKVINKASADRTAQAHLPEVKAKIQKGLKKVQKLLASKNVNFEIIDNEEMKRITARDQVEGFDQMTAEQQGKVLEKIKLVRGAESTDENGKKTILINSDLITDNTAFHEALHSIAAFGKVDQAVWEQWYKELGSVEGFTAYTKQAEANTGSASMEEEAVVEFLADVAAGKADVKVEGIRNALVDMYKHVFTDTDLVDLDKISDQDLMGFANMMATSFKGNAKFSGTKEEKEKVTEVKEEIEKLEETKEDTSEEEAVNKEIIANQKKLGMDNQVPLNLDNSVLVAEERVDSNKPVDLIQLNEASDALYTEYKRMEAMKSATNRQYTTNQILRRQIELGKRIAVLEDAKIELQKFQMISAKLQSLEGEPEAAPVKKTPAQDAVKNQAAMGVIESSGDRAVNRLVEDAKLAEQLMDAEVDPSAIKGATGYSIEDGELVSDIGEGDVALTGQTTSGRVGDIINMPDITENYPAVKGLKANVTIDPSVKQSYATINKNEIRVWAPDEESAKQELVNEVRGVIQTTRTIPINPEAGLDPREYPKKTTFKAQPLAEKNTMKMQAVAADETGFIPTEFWTKALEGNMDYLDNVAKNIVESRNELNAGQVKPSKVIKASILTIGSQQSGQQVYDNWKERTGNELDDAFLETDDKGRKVLRPEGAMAAYMMKPEGKELVSKIENKTATIEEIKPMFEFFTKGLALRKAKFIHGNMENGIYDEVTSDFNTNKGADPEGIFTSSEKLKGISNSKSGFFSHYFGIASKGVVDSRQINAWITGEMSDEKRGEKDQAAASTDIQNEILKRIEQVGLDLGYDQQDAAYMAHHGIWDKMKGTQTQHASEYESLKFQPTLGESADRLKSIQNEQAKVQNFKGLQDVSEVAYNEPVGMTARDQVWEANVKESLPESGLSNKYELDDIIKNKSFAMLTGENPSADQSSDRDNQLKNNEAFEWLATRNGGKYVPIPIFGKYGVPEISFLVPDMAREDALDFIRTFGQESVATNSGLVYQDGSFNPIRRSQTKLEESDNYYSTVKINGENQGVQVSYDTDVRVYPTNLPHGTAVAEKLSKTEDGYIFYKGKDGSISTESSLGGVKIVIPASRVYPIDEDPHDTKFKGSSPDADVVVNGSGNVVTTKFQIVAGDPKWPALTSDGDGNFLFYRRSSKVYEQVQPIAFGQGGATSNAEARDMAGAEASMFYTQPFATEPHFSSKPVTNMVSVPASKVYDVNADPDGYYDEAKSRFIEARGNIAFNENAQIAWVTKIAIEKGYQIGVSNWQTGELSVRAQSTIPLTTQAFNAPPTNFAKGWRTELAPKMDAVYDEIRSYKNSKGEYDDAYNLIEADFRGWSQDDITLIVNTADLPSELVDKYNNVLTKRSKDYSYKKEEFNNNVPVDLTLAEELIGEKALSQTKKGTPEREMVEGYIAGDLTADEFNNAVAGSPVFSPTVKEAARATEPINYSKPIDAENSTPVAEDDVINSKINDNLENKGSSPAKISDQFIKTGAGSSIKFSEVYGRNEIPTRSAQSIIDEFGNSWMVINSDMTGVGTVTTPSGKVIDTRGGFQFTGYKLNQEAKAAFAASSPQKVTYYKGAAKELWGENDGFTAIMIQKPEAMLGNSYALEYLLDGINQLFEKGWITDEQFNDQVYTAMTSTGMLNASFKNKKDETAADAAKRKKALKKSLIEKAEQVRSRNMNHIQLEEYIMSESFDTRKFINMWFLNNMSDKTVGETASPSKLITAAAQNIMDNGAEGADFVTNLTTAKGVPKNQSAVVRLLLKNAGKDGRGFSKLDFYENFADPKIWAAWQKAPLRMSAKGVESNDRVWSHIVGGFTSNGVNDPEAGAIHHPLFNDHFYGKDPVWFDEAYYLNEAVPAGKKTPTGGYAAGSPANKAAISVYEGQEFYDRKLQQMRNKMKLQPASSEDEVNIKRIADQHPTISPTTIAEEISQASGLSYDEVLKIVNGEKPADDNTRVEEDRKTAKNAKVSPELQKRESKAIKNYFVNSQSLAAADAKIIIKDVGVERARALVISPEPWLLPDTRIMLTAELIKMEDERAAAATQIDEKNAILDSINEMRLSVNEDLTRAGQMISAARVLKMGSPETKVREVSKLIRKTAQKKGKRDDLTREEAEEIARLTKVQQKANEGIQKTKATQKLANYIAKVTHDHGVASKRITNILEAIWYSNILSGPSTHNRNIFANFTQWMGEMWTALPKYAVQGDFLSPMKMLGGSFSGAQKGLKAAVYTQLYGTRLDKNDKTEVLPILEWWRYDTGNKFVDTILNYGPWGPQVLKHVGRLLSAGDALFYHTGLEMKASQLATKFARDNRRQKPKQVDFRSASQLMYNDHESIAIAKKQAKDEGFDGKGLKGNLERQIRVSEILNLQRSSAMKEQSDNFAAKMTFNHEPEGFMGAVYRGFTGFAGKPHNKWAKTFIPFARVVSNVTNRYVEWTPYGYIRALKGNTLTGDAGTTPDYRKFTKEERIDMVIKATSGLAAAITLGAASAEDDGWLDITGGLTGDSNKDYQLQSSGWRKYSIRKRGTNKWYSYVDTPLFFMLAGVGTINDHVRLKGTEDLTFGRKLTMAGSGMVGSMMNTSWMMGLSDLMKAVDPAKMEQGDPEFAEKLFDRAMSTIQSIFVANGVRQANRLWLEHDNKAIKQADDWGEKMYRDVPYVQNSLKDIVSAFGIPVKPTNSEKVFFPFHGNVEVDPIAKLYTDNGVFMPRPANFPVYDLATQESYELSDDEMYDFAVFRGKYIRVVTNQRLAQLEAETPERRKVGLQGLMDAVNVSAKAVMGYQGAARENYMKALLSGKINVLPEETE